MKIKKLLLKCQDAIEGYINVIKSMYLKWLEMVKAYGEDIKKKIRLIRPSKAYKFYKLCQTCCIIVLYILTIVTQYFSKTMRQAIERSTNTQLFLLSILGITLFYIAGIVYANIWDKKILKEKEFDFITRRQKQLFLNVTTTIGVGVYITFLLMMEIASYAIIGEHHLRYGFLSILVFVPYYLIVAAIGFLFKGSYAQAAEKKA